MSSICGEVRSILDTILDAQDGHHSRVDVLRVIEKEAMLRKETQHTIDVLNMDPFQEFSEVTPQIDRLQRILRVQSCSRVRATNDYIRTEAVLGFRETDNLELTFLYEQKRRQDECGRLTERGIHVRYSIEMSIRHQRRENLLVAEIWAEKNHPSVKKAVCIHQELVDSITNNDDGGWLDIEDHDGDKGSTIQEVAATKTKRQKLNDTQETNVRADEHAKDDDNDIEEEAEPDSYLVYLDPDVLQEFLELTKLSSAKSNDINAMDEGTAFFLLMTFPFYEHEWDLVGYLLKEIFGENEGESI